MSDASKPNMFNHVVLGTNDIAKARRFYDAIFAVLGVTPAVTGETYAGYIVGDSEFFVTHPVDGRPATFANGGTVAFRASSREQVDAWHAAGLANGGTDTESPPGIRDVGRDKRYNAYLRDPEGNKICAVYRGG
jgi:catechol 2,3-dioxygenase-like lactoylglutathione lyase family enzyme